MYGDKISLGEVEILSADVQQSWSENTANNRTNKPLSQRKRPRRLFEKRIVAFPLHSQNPLHWTLGILVNLNWKSLDLTCSTTRDAKWILFHFDSLSSNSELMSTAIQFSKFLVEVPANHNVNGVMVPALRQPTCSVDCALYPFHFLRVFLQDREKYIEYCRKVRLLSDDITCLNNKRTWITYCQTVTKQEPYGTTHAVWHFGWR